MPELSQPVRSSRNPVRNAAVAMTVTAACIYGVGQHEGFVGHTYRDPTGTPTIGFGETKGVVMGQTITREDATVLLGNRVAEHAAGMAKCIKVPVSQNEFDAYADFTYNIGIAGFCRSSVATKLNAMDYEGACAELLKFVYSKGQILPGLVNRRKEEYRVCLG